MCIRDRHCGWNFEGIVLVNVQVGEVKACHDGDACGTLVGSERDEQKKISDHTNRLQQSSLFKLLDIPQQNFEKEDVVPDIQDPVIYNFVNRVPSLMRMGFEIDRFPHGKGSDRGINVSVRQGTYFDTFD